MTRLWGALAAIAFAFAVLPSAGEALIRPWAGNATPSLAASDLTGRTVDLKDLRGRVVLVNFWATWCEPCRDEMPSLQRLRSKLDGKPFEVVTVNYGEGLPKIEAFLRKEKLSLTVLLDPEKEVAGAWRAGGLPMTFLVDSKGQVRYSAFGERDWSQGDGLRLVENLVAEAPRARR